MSGHFTFIEYGGKSATAGPNLAPADRMQVRSHAMKDYRRRQRSHACNDREQAGSRDEQCCSCSKPKARLRIRGRYGSRPVTCNCHCGSCKANHQIVSAGDAAKFPQEETHNYILPHPYTFNNAQVYRCVLGTSYLEGMIGIDGLRSIDGCMTINTLITATSLAQKAAYDALVLLHLGTVKADERAILMARRRHLEAIQLLREEIVTSISKRTGVASDSHIGAAQLLLGCEVYGPVSSGSELWSTQLSAIIALMGGVKQVKQIHQMSKLRLLLVKKLRHLDLMDALTNCRPVSPSLCLELPHVEDSPAGIIERLFQMAMQLPGLLVTSKNMQTSQDQTGPGIAKTMEDLVDLEREFCSWLSEHFQSDSELFDPAAQAAANIVHTAPLTKGKTCVQSLAGTVRFPSLLSASICAFYWTCIFLLREANFDLIMCSSGITKHSQRSITRNVDEAAESLLMCIPSLSKLASGKASKAASVLAPLYFGSNWFRGKGKRKSREKLRWCEKLEDEFCSDLEGFDRNTSLPWSFLILSYIF